jgi:hypothetical protein
MKRSGNVTKREVGQDKLDHYNAWLLDPSRPIDGTPYPGYPGDSVETVQSSPVFSEEKSNKNNKLPRSKVTVAVLPKVSHNKNTKSMKGSVMKKVTNLSKATEIVRAQVDSRTPKSEILEMIVKELGVTRSNAFVYFTKATKALDISITVDKGATSAPKKAKVNPVTETSPEKAKARVAEIDRVIAGLRKTGAAVSPFAALGV